MMLWLDDCREPIDGAYRGSICKEDREEVWTSGRSLVATSVLDRFTSWWCISAAVVMELSLCLLILLMLSRLRDRLCLGVLLMSRRLSLDTECLIPSNSPEGTVVRDTRPERAAESRSHLEKRVAVLN